MFSLWSFSCRCLFFVPVQFICSGTTSIICLQSANVNNIFKYFLRKKYHKYSAYIPQEIGRKLNTIAEHYVMARLYSRDMHHDVRASICEFDHDVTGHVKSICRRLACSWATTACTTRSGAWYGLTGGHTMRVVFMALVLSRHGCLSY